MALIVQFKGKTPRIAPTAFIAPNATIVGDVDIGENASVWFGAVLRADYGPIRIGDECNVQDNVVVHSDAGQATILEPRVTVGHAAILHGCWIDSGSLIGMGAILLTGSRVGAGAMIAAGSVVQERYVVPPEMLAAGIPAVVKKRVEGRAAEWQQLGAVSYVELSNAYRTYASVE